MEPVAAWYVSNVCSARRRRKTAFPAASRSRPAPATATATPGRSASTADTPSASGSAGPTARRCRAWSGAWRRRRSCSTLSPACRRRPRRCRAPPSGVLVTTSAKLPPPLRHFAAGRPRRRAAGRAAYPVSAGWRAARSTRGGRQAGAGPAQTHRRRRPGHDPGQRRAGFGAAAWDAVLSAAGARIRPRDRDRWVRSRRQRDGAAG